MRKKRATLIEALPASGEPWRAQGWRAGVAGTTTGLDQYGHLDHNHRMKAKGPQALNIAEAKRLLSELVGRVGYGGETIVIMRRGKPVAKLAPLTARERQGSSGVDADVPTTGNATVNDLMDVLEAHGRGDETFADDLVRVRTEVGTPGDPWAA